MTAEAVRALAELLHRNSATVILGMDQAALCNFFYVNSELSYHEACSLAEDCISIGLGRREIDSEL